MQLCSYVKNASLHISYIQTLMCAGMIWNDNPAPLINVLLNLIGGLPYCQHNTVK